MKTIAVSIAIAALSYGASTNIATAQATDFRTCVAKNEQFGGASAACAAQICNWEVCKDEIIYSTGTTSRHTSASYRKDVGASGSALATCKPKEQVMKQCQAANAAAPGTPTNSTESAPKAPPWCKTGSDADLIHLRVKMDAIKTERRDILKKKKTLEAQLQRHQAAINAVADPIKTMLTEYRADMAAKNAGNLDSESLNAKWVNSGRLRRGNEMIAASNEQKQQASKIRNEINNLYNVYYKPLDDKYTHVGRDMLERDRDCAGALIALK